MTTGGTEPTWRGWLLAGASAPMLMQGASALAQDAMSPADREPVLVAQAQQTYDFDIPSKPLPQAIADFSAVTGLQVLYTEPSTFGHTAPALRGTFTADQALDRLVAGSGLAYRYTSATTVTLERTVALEENGLAQLEPVTVTATRFATPISDVPAAITIIDRDEIETNPAFTRNIQAGLSQSIPGASLTDARGTSITIRGRDVSYRINGVEISQRGRGSDIAVQDLAPSAFESIDVVRGTDSTFGFGFDGGAVNFRTPQPTPGAAQFTSVAGIDFQTQDLGDSLGYRLRQEVTGTWDRFGYAISGGARFSGTQFDPDGDPYPDTSSFRRSNADVFDVNATFTVSLDEHQAIETTQYYFRAESDPKFELGQPGDIATDQKATSRPASPDDFDLSQNNRQYVSTYSYRHDDLWGNRLDLTGFYQDNNARRSFDNPGRVVGTFDEGNQRYGVRSSVQTPLWFLDDTLFHGAAVTWGVDFQDYEYLRTEIRGPEPQSQVFPEIEERLIAGHLQVNVPVGERIDLTGGLRHEHGKATLADIEGRPRGGDFEGGDLDFDTTLYNAGLTFHLTDELNVYGSFSQSAGILDFGRGSVRVNRAEDLEPELDPTDQFEIGFRGDYEQWQFTAAAFYSRSELGQSFELDPSGNVAVPVPRPRQNWGVELTLDTQPLEELWVGGTFSFNDGREELADGTSVAQSHLTTVPPTFTGYVDYRPFPWWRNRLTVTHRVASGEQDDRIRNGLRGSEALDAKTFVNLFARLEPGFVPGALDLGIENLLNTREFDVAAQGQPRLDRLFLYPARTFTVTYRLDW